MKTITLFIACCLNFSAFAELTPAEKDKVLFMIYENQNLYKKTITKEQPVCKKDSSEWACLNSTVRAFLMNLTRVNQAQGFTQTTQIDCEPITGESLKNMDSSPTAQLWATEFQREVKQSLKEQWVCKMEVSQSDMQQKKMGIAFIMNRDKSRIVSRKFSAWRIVQ